MDSFSEYESFDGLGLADLVKNKVISQAELLEAAIQRIELRNPKYNAIIHKMYDEARASVKQTNHNSLFSGVPFLLKDLLADYNGTPMRCGSRMMQNYISSFDSEVVTRFKNAGLVILGKTNIPEFGLAPVTEPEMFGPTLNPWDVTKSCGGSSGGSAVAVATGMVPMAHGGDGAGSIRVPASFCGIFGLKPSRGRVPTGPRVMRIWQGLVTEHVLTRSVRDSAAMLDVLSGPEVGSPISLPKSNFSFLEHIQKKPKLLRIAVSDQPFFPSQIAPEYGAAIQKAGQLCEKLGHQVENVSFHINGEETAYALMILVAAETRSMITATLELLKEKKNPKTLEIATALLSEAGKSFTAADFAWATYIVDKIGRQTGEFFEKYDVLLTPTTKGPPPRLGELQLSWVERQAFKLFHHLPLGSLLRKIMKSKSSQFFEFLPFTPLFNLSGQPAMSVPLYWDSQGLPIGIHFAGRLQEEGTLLQLAKQLEEAEPWFNKRPV